ncbi:MAG: hypothetical protein P8X42_07035 [Calditrichaceae bacterium]|jgi:hypothetical protein
MTTKELRHKVINKVKKLEDENLLNDLIRIIDENTDDNEIYRLSDNHKKAINTAIGQIEKGDYLTNEKSDEQIEAWLKR